MSDVDPVEVLPSLGLRRRRAAESGEVAPPAPYVPAWRDLHVWRGQATPVDLRFLADGGPLDLWGSVMVFAAAWDGGSHVRSSATGGVTLVTADGRMSLVLAAADAAAMPPGAGTRYEIRRIIDGTTTVLLYGSVIVSEWM